MSMNDPIADLLTRIRNACLRKHKEVNIPYSTIKEGIVKLFQEEGFIGAVEKTQDNSLKVVLKYDEHKNPVIRKIQRVSKPGLRQYRRVEDITPLMSGQGVFVLSTSQGLLSDRECKKRNIGGEVICLIY
jgi:small subunit ribosomal protein S8